MEKTTVHPRNITLHNNKKEIKDILGLESVVNPFKLNIYPTLDIRKIGLISSVQANTKARKSSLKGKLKFTQIPLNQAIDKDTYSITSDDASAKKLVKRLLVDSTKSLGETTLDTPLFLAVTPDELTNTILRCLIKDNPSDWRVTRA